jgi:hypothetical protein
MTDYKFGVIVLVPFPFTDQTATKKRPAVDSRIEPLAFRPEDYADGGILIDEIKRTGQELF